MKTVLSWLCDPCVHLLVVGLILAHFAMKMGEGSSSSAGARASVCETCHEYHAATQECPTAVPSSTEFANAE
jgi:hypothetical protein